MQGVGLRGLGAPAAAHSGPALHLHIAAPFNYPFTHFFGIDLICW